MDENASKDRFFFFHQHHSPSLLSSLDALNEQCLSSKMYKRRYKSDVIVKQEYIAHSKLSNTGIGATPCDELIKKNLWHNRLIPRKKSKTKSCRKFAWFDCCWFYLNANDNQCSVINFFFVFFHFSLGISMCSKNLKYRDQIELGSVDGDTVTLPFVTLSENSSEFFCEQSVIVNVRASNTGLGAHSPCVVIMN